jgi:hypothetical protein
VLRDDRERFEQEYRDWMRLMSRDELYEEFQGGSEFLQRTYDLFIREILLNLRDENRGYG